MIHTKELEQYLENNSSQEDALLHTLNRETHLKVMSPNMVSGKVQGIYLETVSRAIKPKQILEIGTFTGYATICLAKGLCEDGQIHTIESNKEIIYLSEKYFQASEFRDKIIQHIGDATMIIKKLDQKFDLVFIDADKENYLNYYNLIIDKMNKGGVILADNVLWNGKVLEDKKDKKTQAIHEFNQYVTSDERVKNYILPLRDGIHYIQVL